MVATQEFTIANMPISYLVGKTMAEIEAIMIELALKECNGNRARAAAMLQIGERSLYRKISK